MEEADLVWSLSIVLAVVSCALMFINFRLIQSNAQIRLERRNALEVAARSAVHASRSLHHAAAMANMLAVVMDGLPAESHPDVRIELRNRMNAIFGADIVLGTDPVSVDRTQDFDAGEIPVCHPQSQAPL